MGIKNLYKEIFERIILLDKKITNPFLDKNEESTNPFAKFYSGTYVWIEKPDNKNKN